MTSTAPIISYTFAKDHGIVVLDEGDLATLGVRDGAPARALIEVRRVLRRPLSVKTLTKVDFEKALSEIYATQGIDSEALSDELADEDSLSSLADGLPQTADLLDTADDAPIIRLINGLIAEAAKRKASDIHIEPYETKLSVRLRIDGVLQEILSFSQRVAPRLVSRVKVMARLDIAERRVPQDGRISLTIGGKSLDVRVSTLPAQYGERVVLRLLDKSHQHFGIDQLGMTLPIREAFRRAITEPNGIILVSGPTGSGKTTSLYAGLAFLNDQSRNILTVEDPVEYALDGVGQTQVNTKVGMTFAAGLRAILRQDPDVVMVGEIRDPETASIAVQASLTGHLVLSTIHTNSAVSAVTRLRDMGVEPFLLSSTVKAIVAQRLVRKLCDHCKSAVDVTERDRRVLGKLKEGVTKLYEPVGCDACANAGYSGRLGLYELVTVDASVRRMIHDDAPEEDIAAHAFKANDTLIISGLRHVAAGQTCIDEVLRVCRQVGETDVGV
jgi:general secretion pathway protein E